MDSLSRRTHAGLSTPPRRDHEPLVWPSSRYFQIHFEHLHTTLAAMNQELEYLRHQVADLQWRIRCEAAQRGEGCHDCPKSACGELAQ